MAELPASPPRMTTTAAKPFDRLDPDRRAVVVGLLATLFLHLFLLLAVEPPKLVWSSPIPVSERGIAYLENLATLPAKKEGRIEMVVPYQLHALEGAGGKLSGVVVSDLDGNNRTLAADALLPFFGLSMSLGPIAEWGLELERNQILVDPATSATSAKGIFAVGDVVHYPGKLKLILQGFSEAAMAAHAILVIILRYDGYHKN